MSLHIFKHRGWFEDENELYYPDEKDEMRMIITPANQQEDDFMLERYTEVDDINFVEMYENDVVRVKVSQPFESEELGGRYSVIGVVKYDEGAYWIDWGTGRTRLWSETLQMTVLGNVHQNPELLEVF